jgi:hypothetical protein
MRRTKLYAWRGERQEVRPARRPALQDVDAEHPPYEKQGDDGHDEVSNPLPDGLGLGLELHGIRRAVRRPN